jgi:hypothetical protein
MKVPSPFQIVTIAIFATLMGILTFVTFTAYASKPGHHFKIVQQR